MQTKRQILALCLLSSTVCIFILYRENLTKVSKFSDISSEHAHIFQQFDKPISGKQLRKSPDENQDSSDFMITEENKCEPLMDTTPFLLVGVYTGINEVSTREFVRKHWGMEASKNPKIRIIFVVGYSLDHFEMSRLKNESKRYHDIVQGNFIDSYQNLTLKSFIFFKWADKYCKSAEYLLKIDSDMQINLTKLLSVLEKGNLPDTIICGWILANNKVLRNEKSKWYVPLNMYSENIYPNHCHGAAYIVPSRISKKIAAVPVPKTPFPVDDAYITGILRETLQEDLKKGILTYHHHYKPTETEVQEGGKVKYIMTVKVLKKQIF